MKTAIYIEDGTIQLVITPESKFEKDALASFQDKEFETEIFEGSFYDCRGGWVRQKGFFNSNHGFGYNTSDNNDKSLILRTKTESPGDES